MGEIHQGPAAGPAQSGRVPLWVIAATALLVAAGFGRCPPRAPHPARGDHSNLEIGRDGSTTTPSEIPVRGWKDILLRVYHGVSDNRILLVAAGVTFYLLLATFPGIAALISIYGLFADPATVAGHLDTIASVAPGGAVDVLGQQMTRLASQGRTTLGISFVVSLAISLWTANSGVKAIFDALNIVYGEEEKRGFLKLNAITLSVTLGIVAFILLTLAAIVAIPVALTYIPLPEVTALVVRIGRWPILFALVTTALAVLYKYGPSRTEPRWRWITWGSVSAAIVWLAASVLFSLERWRLGAEHAGWKFGWRDAPIAGDLGRRFVETYCYAFAGTDFLEDEPQQLYWRTDIVQMTRYYMIEAARSGMRLSPRRAGFPV
jgi:membrane protein